MMENIKKEHKRNKEATIKETMKGIFLSFGVLFYSACSSPADPKNLNAEVEKALNESLAYEIPKELPLIENQDTNAPSNPLSGKELPTVQTQDGNTPQNPIVESIEPAVIIAQGEKLMRQQGCVACHFQKTGMALKPFPSLPHMASLSYDEFKNCVLNGRAGTTMVAWKLPENQVQAIQTYVGTFSGQ